MNMKCRDLFELKSFRKIKLVAGERGLNRSITWVYINQDTAVKEWIHGGELVFVTGMNAKYQEGDIVRLVRECVENSASGVVILCNPQHIKSIPSSVLAIADELGIPLFEMPWDLKIVDVTREIADTIITNQFEEQSAMAFFSELLFAADYSETSVRNMAIHCGTDVDKSALIAVVRSDFKMGGEESLSMVNALKKTLEDCLYYADYGSVSCVYMDEIFIYVNTDEPQKLKKLFIKAGENFAERHPKTSIQIGIGQSFGGVRVRESYRQARQAADFASGKNHAVSVSLFSEMGILQLLSTREDKEALKDYCYRTLSPLIDSDNCVNTEYVATVKAYLENNCSLVKAAEAMYLHRNTLVYRIEKIKSLTGIDFNDAIQKCEFMNAIRIISHFGFDWS